MSLRDHFVPAWRHSDAEVRAAAVRQLGSEAEDALAAVSQHDDDPRIRRIAVKKLANTDLLQQIAASDADGETRQLAEQRRQDLLVERAVSSASAEECLRALEQLQRPADLVRVASSAAAPQVRSAALARVSEEPALADIVRRTSDSDIGAAALARIHDRQLLRRIAAGSGGGLGLAAVERIDEPETLHSLAEDSQVAKPVRKRARERLMAVAGEDHPLRVAQRRDRLTQLCIAVERLNARDADAAADALHDLEQQWRELAGQSEGDADLGTRFRVACAALAEDIQRARQRALEQSRRLGARQHSRSRRQELCELVEGLDGAELPEKLAAAKAAWSELPPDPECHDLATRFGLAVERCEQRYQRWQAREGFHARIVALVEQAEQLVVDAGEPAAALRRWSKLEKRWAEIEVSPEASKWLADERLLQRRFAAAGEALQDQQRRAEAEQERQEREARARITATCERLEQLDRSESIGVAAANRALRSAAEALGLLKKLPPATRQGLRERLLAAQASLEQKVEQLAKAEEWKRWANAEVQQQLIERAEALLAADDPQAILKQLGPLEQEWQRFATAPREQSQALWQRFRAAREGLRQKRTTYLRDNLARKEALCAAAEKLADSTEWNATAQALQEMQAEWKQIGPVPQKLSAALFERFRGAANQFFERRKAHLAVRKEQRQERLGEMQALCQQAESLAESSEWEAALAEIRKLQASARQLWPRPVPGKDRQSEALRERVRTAFDRFFERYRRRDEIAAAGQLAEAEKVLVDLEALRTAVLAGEEASGETLRDRLGEALQRWLAVTGTIPESAALATRVQAACDAIAEAWQEGFGEALPDVDAGIKPREKVCARLERLIESVSQIEVPAGDLAERLRLAIAARTIGGGALPPHQQAKRDAAAEAEKLQAKWQRLGPVVGKRARELAERYAAAQKELAKRLQP